MRIINCPQGSPEWFQARSGVITASNVAETRRRLKSGANKGDFTTAAHNLAFQLAVERIKDGPVDQDQYETYSMRRGKELEEDARLLHEDRLGILIGQSGVVLSDCGKFGYSTDGFIGDSGLAEYKCFLDMTKVREILFASSTDDVMDQVQTGMWLTDRAWCDFALYFPDLECNGLNLFIKRIIRHQSYIDELVSDLYVFDGLVENYIERIDELAERQRIGTAPAPGEIAEDVDLGNIF